MEKSSRSLSVYRLLTNMDSDFASEDFFLKLGQVGTHYGLQGLMQPSSRADGRFRWSGGVDHPATGTWLCRHTFSRLCTAHINLHSERIAARPRSENCRKPSTCFN